MASRWEVFKPKMSPIYDLIIDLPDGIATKAVVASDGQEAFAIGRKLFPGCRLAGVMRDEEEDGEDEMV